MAIPWGPIVSGVGALGSSLISNIGAKKREAEARKQNVEFWKMQNKYNLPSAQMQRLKDAGLNPNLIYGSSPAGAGGNAGAISPAKAAPYNIQNPVPPPAMLIESQAIKNYSDSIYSKAKADEIEQLVGARLNQLEIGNDIANIRLEIAGKTKQAQIDNVIANADIAKLGAVVKETEADYAKRGLRMDTVGQIFTSLNLSPTNPDDQKIIKGLIGAWYAAKMLGNILGPGLAAKAKQWLGVK